jgi:hypothetical protein
LRSVGSQVVPSDHLDQSSGISVARWFANRAVVVGQRSISAIDRQIYQSVNLTAICTSRYSARGFPVTKQLNRTPEFFYLLQLSCPWAAYSRPPVTGAGHLRRSLEHVFELFLSSRVVLTKVEGGRDQQFQKHGVHGPLRSLLEEFAPHEPCFDRLQASRQPFVFREAPCDCHCTGTNSNCCQRKSSGSQDRSQLIASHDLSAARVAVSDAREVTRIMIGLALLSGLQRLEITFGFPLHP